MYTYTLYRLQYIQRSPLAESLLPRVLCPLYLLGTLLAVTGSVHLGLRLLVNLPPLPQPFPIPSPLQIPCTQVAKRLTKTTSRIRLLLSGTVHTVTLKNNTMGRASSIDCSVSQNLRGYCSSYFFPAKRFLYEVNPENNMYVFYYQYHVTRSQPPNNCPIWQIFPVLQEYKVVVTGCRGAENHRWASLTRDLTS